MPEPESDLTGTSEDASVRASGGLVLRLPPDLGEEEVLLVHRPRYDDWSFPKGKAEADETDEQAALREITEETGIVGELGDELGTVRYRDRRGRPKRVRYWVVAVRDDLGFEPNDEVDELRWLPRSRAARLLTYEHDRRLLREIPSVSTDS